ncbi:MAG: hypothetical protein IPM39_21460 [Chloroflexi bacterium]|nr:hypothetical protein [Chloroflexota bacterium]
MKFHVVFWLLLICTLAACASAAQDAPTPPPLAQVTDTAVSPTPTTSSPTAAPAEATTAPTASVSPTPGVAASATSTAAAAATAAPSATPSPTATATATAAPQPSPTPRPTAVPLSDLPNFAGQELLVNGRIIATASFSHGFKFTLDDGTGRATLLLWHNVYDDAWDAPRLNVGSVVRATGLVEQHEGEWQIVPDFGGDVKVTTAGGPFAPVRPIGELGQHVGELAQISGAIIRLESTSSSVKLFVADESGEIVVLIWRNVLERIANNVALGEAGTRVQVNGRVEMYRSNLQLVPALPYDVLVQPNG